MNQTLIRSMTQEEQARLLNGVYTLLEKQVKHYQKHYHLGDDTSVTVETARALTDSVWYTLEKAGGDLLHEDLNVLLARGQAILETQMEDAKKKLTLVTATMPSVCSDSYRDTVETIAQFLRRYDPAHFAHQTPDFLEYPLLCSDWEPLRGIDRVDRYLWGLWQENQILANLDFGEADELFSRLGPDWQSIPMNLCEQPIINAMGRVLLGDSIHPLILSEEERWELKSRLSPENLDGALDAVCQAWDIQSPQARAYAHLVLPQLKPRLAAAREGGGLAQVFL